MSKSKVRKQTKPEAVLLEQLQLAFAKFYSAKMSENVKRGIEAKKAKVSNG